MSVRNLVIRLTSRPKGLPSVENFKAAEEVIPSPRDQQVLVRNIYLSLDPAMRGWMTDRKSYVEPVKLGDVMRGITVGEVVESNYAGLKQGDLVSGVLGWAEYSVGDGKGLNKVVDVPGAPLSAHLSVLGMTGLTAYFGLLDVGKPRPGDTVMVSGAAGAVGSVVGQIAKIGGCNVVGIAGSEQKCDWIRSIGFDHAINYRSHLRDDEDEFMREMAKAIRKDARNGVDVFFDNIGGPILDAGLANLNIGARVAVCGAISQYNSVHAYAPKQYYSLLVNRAKMEGFIVFDYAKRYREGVQRLSKWLNEGKIDYKEHIIDGLGSAPLAINKLFDGSNEGKLIVAVGDEPKREK